MLNLRHISNGIKNNFHRSIESHSVFWGAVGDSWMGSRKAWLGLPIGFLASYMKSPIALILTTYVSLHESAEGIVMMEKTVWVYRNLYFHHNVQK